MATGISRVGLDTLAAVVVSMDNLYWSSTSWAQSKNSPKPGARSTGTLSCSGFVPFTLCAVLIDKAHGQHESCRHRDSGRYSFAGAQQPRQGQAGPAASSRCRYGRITADPPRRWAHGERSRTAVRGRVRPNSRPRRKRPTRPPHNSSATENDGCCHPTESPAVRVIAPGGSSCRRIEASGPTMSSERNARSTGATTWSNDYEVHAVPGSRSSRTLMLKPSPRRVREKQKPAVATPATAVPIAESRRQAIWPET